MLNGAPSRKEVKKSSRPGVTISKSYKGLHLDISADVPKLFQDLFESIIHCTELQTRYGMSSSLFTPLTNLFYRYSLGLFSRFAIAAVTPPLHQLLPRETYSRPC